MAQQVTQMAARNGDSATALKDVRRASFEMPTRPSRGLDTGARGWRWVVATPGTRRMVGSQGAR